jgi:long-chain acyl-CoA synthetase
MANFSARIASAAARFADRPAIEVVRAAGVETTSYAALIERAGRFAAWLASTDFARGDRAAILADNDAHWIECYLGILHLGGVAVPFDTAYKPAQVRAILDSCGARVLFTTPRYLDTARAAGALPGSAMPTLALLSGTAPDLPGPDQYATAVPVPLCVDTSDEDAAVLLYTSGTTADPKGVVLTHGNLEAERRAAFQIVDVTEHDAVLGVLPLFHALAQMANLLLPLSVGGRVVFLETVSSTSLLEALNARGITIFACVPQFFYLIHQRVTGEVRRRGALARAAFRGLIDAGVWLRDHLGWNPGRRLFARVHRVLGPRMRMLITGGSRFDPAIGRDLYGMGFTLLNAYGLTETSGGATIMRPGDRFTTSVGQPFPGVDIRIAPRETADAEAGDGEVLIRGPIIMREYFGRPDATADTLRDGWLHTGDLGRLDADGRLYITGRKKEIIVLSSGKNLYPEEIEAHYRQSAFIKELAVLGLARPGEPAAERLHAVVVPDEQALRERGAVNLRELIRFEIEGRSVHLPAYKRILSYDISLDPLPRTSTGKIRRHEIERRLRERAAATTEAERPPSDAEIAWLTDADHRSALEAIARRLDRRQVRPDANLELDLGLDSMERVELLTMLERRARTQVAPEARATIFTVRQLVEAVRAGEPAVHSGGEDGVPGGADGIEAWDAILTGAPDAALIEGLRRPKPLRALVLFALIRMAGGLARLLPGFRVSGIEHLPADGPFIISPNHQSYLDAFFLAAALPYRVFSNLFFVGAAEYFQTPLMAWAARSINIVPVDPDANLVSAMQAGAAGLRLGKVLMLFPEGERSIDGELKKFRKGAAILSAHLDVPVVPVALDGLFAIWPRGRAVSWRLLLPGRTRPVTLAFGPPIRPGRDAHDEGTEALRDAVAGMIDRIRRASDPSVLER